MYLIFNENLSFEKKIKYSNKIERNKIWKKLKAQVGDAYFSIEKTEVIYLKICSLIEPFLPVRLLLFIIHFMYFYLLAMPEGGEN